MEKLFVVNWQKYEFSQNFQKLNKQAGLNKAEHDGLFFKNK